MKPKEQSFFRKEIFGSVTQKIGWVGCDGIGQLNLKTVFYGCKIN